MARALLQALDAQESLPGRWTLLSPQGCTWPVWRQVVVQNGGWRGMPGHLWEQSVVAAASWRGARVLNIAGSGPWLGGAQVSWLHDAAVFDHPEAYRPGFVRWYRALFRHRARRGDLLLTPSQHARERLAHHLGVSVQRLAVLPHGGDHLDAVVADVGVVQRLQLQSGRFWLCVASHNPNKNLARLFRAHARLPAPRWPIVWVGGEHRRVFAATGSAQPPADVRLLPQASDAELKALMHAARALLMPSRVEGFGLPALEALRQGCAVMAARAAALPEVCGDAALYIDPSSDDDITAALQRLAADDALVETLRRAGPLRAASWTWDVAAKRLLGLLGLAALPALEGAA